MLLCVQDFMRGILPASWGGRKGGRWTSEMEEMMGGRGVGGRGGVTGRGGMLGGHDLGDYASEKMGDIQYAARRAGDSIKDTGYGIGHKMRSATLAAPRQAAFRLACLPLSHSLILILLFHWCLSEFADSVKSKFVGGEHEDYYGQAKEGVKRKVGGRGGGGLFGGGYADEDEDLMSAKEKMRRVVRQADREL
jgi:hypothetical protein